MKRLFFIGLLFLTGCFEDMPNDFKAQIASEHYLDSLNLPLKVEDKTGIGFITLKEYFNGPKQAKFQYNIDFYHPYHPSKTGWDDFTKDVNTISSKEKRLTKGVIQVEQYRINKTKYTTAFLVDSTCSKVVASIQLN